ncbi:DsrE family protein [Roseateles puraquae]|uniref:DsrE family protein n=1 Tax=Roseateles puraquae TaxID=431059 RepID=UPI0031D8F030
MSRQGLAILLWAADPADPVRLATPFAQAAAGAALELQVEVYFTARSVLLLQPGVADALRASTRFDKSIASWMQDALDHGARFLACTDALAAHGLTHADLIPAARQHGGAVQFAARAADPAWATLVF